MQKKQISIFSFLIENTVGDTEGYSFLMPVLKALLEKSHKILNLSVQVPDLPPTASGPVFFNDFQMYITTQQWCSFIKKKVCSQDNNNASDVCCFICFFFI